MLQMTGAQVNGGNGKILSFRGKSLRLTNYVKGQLPFITAALRLLWPS
jgi:hypothetical protein